MIFVGTVKEFNGKELASTQKKLFNTSRVAELIADGADGKFKYTRNGVSMKSPLIEVKVDETKAAIDALFGGDDLVISLPVLKKRVPGYVRDFVQTVSVAVGKIAGGDSDEADATKTWVKVQTSPNRMDEYLVDMPIDALAGVTNVISYSFLNAPNDALSADVTGTINYATNAIALTVPAATVVTALVATFTLSTGASAKVGATAQVSGTTANNFTNPVAYVVTGADGRTETWTVTVTIAA